MTSFRTLCTWTAFAAVSSACALDFSTFDPRATTGPGAGGTTVGPSAGGATTSVGGAAAGGAGGSGLVGGGGTGGGDPVECGGLGVLTTSFDAGPQPKWWQLTEVGKATVKPNALESLEFVLTAPGYAIYKSSHHFRFDDHVQIELVDVSAMERFTLGFAIDASDYVTFGRRPVGDVLRYEVVVGGNAISAGSLGAFDPAMHRFLRIRKTPTGLAFEHSADGQSFTGDDAAVGVDQFDFDSVQLTLHARNFSGDFTNPITAIVDNLYGGAPSQLCGSDSVAVDFGAHSGDPPPHYAELTTGCNADYSGAGIVFNALATGVTCEIGPRQGFTPTSVVAQLAEPVILEASNSTHIGLQVYNGDEWASFGVEGGKWTCWANPVTAPPARVTGPTYDPTKTHWRIDINNGLLVGSVADASLSWTEVCQSPFTAGPWPYWVALHQDAEGAPIADDSMTLRAFGP